MAPHHRYVAQLRQDQATLTYTPSDPIDLGSCHEIFPPIEELTPKQLAVPLVAKERNNKALRELHSKTADSYVKNGEFNRRLRWRTGMWSLSQSCEDVAQAFEEAPWMQGVEEFDTQLPRAFRFDTHSEAMHRYWTPGRLADESAILRPTPSRLLLTPRSSNRDESHGEVEPIRGAETPSSAGQSTHATTTKKAKLTTRALKRKGTEAVETSSDVRHIPSQRADSDRINDRSTGILALDPILSISVYSRPLIKPNRQTARSAKAEQRHAAHLRESSGMENRGHGDTNDRDEGVEDEQSARMPEGRSELFQPRLGPEGEPAVPSQKLLLYASQTLQEFRDSIICRMDDLPEVEPREPHLGSDGPDNLKSRVRCTGRKRSSPTYLLIEDLLVSDEDGSTDATTLGRLMKDLRKTDSSAGTDTSAIHRADETLRSTRFCDLHTVRLHKPYRMCHQNICEHFWTIDEIRLPHQDDPAQPSASTRPLQYTAPVTTFLSASALNNRPLPLWTRHKAAAHIYSLGMCGLCTKVQAKYAIVGGAGIDGGRSELGGNEANGSDSHLHRLPNLPSEIEQVCHPCLALFLGAPIARGGHKKKQSQKQSGDRTKPDQTASQSGDVLQRLNELAARNADISQDATWLEVSKRLRVERDWTVVPLLD